MGSLVQDDLLIVTEIVEECSVQWIINFVISSALSRLKLKFEIWVQKLDKA